jgi:hypothetical protein
MGLWGMDFHSEKPEGAFLCRQNHQIAPIDASNLDRWQSQREAAGPILPDALIGALREVTG